MINSHYAITVVSMTRPDGCKGHLLQPMISSYECRSCKTGRPVKPLKATETILSFQKYNARILMNIAVVGFILYEWYIHKETVLSVSDNVNTTCIVF